MAGDTRIHLESHMPQMYLTMPVVTIQADLLDLHGMLGPRVPHCTVTIYHGPC